MKDLAELVVKGITGGTLVVVFALVAEIVRHKTVSGIFSAAPSVAIASLFITLVVSGAHDASLAALGMVAGAAGLTAACVAGVDAVRRLRAARGSLVVVLTWVVVTGSLYGLLLR